MTMLAAVFIENYKVGARYGLAYSDLQAINPRLIYCSITGFGQDGPLSKLAGYDFIVQAMGGLMSITGERDELPGGGPQKVGVAFADLMTGMYSTVGILAALAHRTETGEGQYLDMALLDVQVAAMANMNLNYLVSGKTPKREGNAHANARYARGFASPSLGKRAQCGESDPNVSLADSISKCSSDAWTTYRRCAGITVWNQ